MMRLKRRTFTFMQTGLALLGLAGIAYTAPLMAQANYPSRPVTIVVPHPAGGSVDGVARIFAEKLREELKESVVVDNRPGASGMIGADTVARAAPDGYTLYVNASIHSINPLLYKKSIKFDAVKDFTAISQLAQGALIFSVNLKVPASTVQELIKEIKASPKAYSFGSTGFGSAGHLGTAQFLHEAGLSQLQIPVVLYKGAAPALQDLIGGQISALMDPMLSSLPLVKTGKLRALAVTGRERSPLLPDVPTMRESQLGDFEFYSWYGLWAPANIPEPVRMKLEAAAAKIMQSADMKKYLNERGFDPAYKNSSDFAKYIGVEMTRYQAIIDKANITID